MQVKELKALMADFGKVIPASSRVAVLDNIRVSDGYMHVSNLEVHILAKVPIEGEGYVPFHALNKLLAKTEATTVEISWNEDNKVIIDFEGDIFTFQTSTDEWIKDVPLDDYSVELEEFVWTKEFSVVPKFAGKDELRPTMNGVFFGKEHIVATDARKLIWMPYEGQVHNEFIVPKDVAKLLKVGTGYKVSTRAHVWTEQEIAEHNRIMERREEKERRPITDDDYIESVSFTKRGLLYIFRAIHGKYPNYMAVLPKDNPNLHTMDKKALTKKLEMAMIAANSTTYLTKLTFEEDTLTLTTEDIDFGREYKGSVPCVREDGEGIAIGVDAKLMVEVLGYIDCHELRIATSQPDRALIMNGNILLMPVMLTN